MQMRVHGNTTSAKLVDLRKGRRRPHVRRTLPNDGSNCKRLCSPRRTYKPFAQFLTGLAMPLSTPSTPGSATPQRGRRRWASNACHSAQQLPKMSALSLAAGGTCPRSSVRERVCNFQWKKSPSSRSTAAACCIHILELAAAPAAANCLRILCRLLRNRAEAAACDRATMQSRMQCVQSIHEKTCVYCVPLNVL